jgi:acetyl esterase/lipase
VTPFHPELRTSAALFRFFLPLGLLRALYRLRGVPRPPRVTGLEIHDRHFSAGDGETLRVRIYRRAGTTGAGPALLWIHGGGYVMGSPELHEKSSVDFARTLGVTVVAVSYRVAPKWPFPTPLHDCYSALCWMHRHAGELGIDRERIAVGGASAGAGLSAALAQLAHDRQEVPIRFQLLIYPMLDDRSAIRPDIEHRKLRLWTQKNNEYGWTAYLGQSPGQPEVLPYSVPARRQCLRGLPPAWIGVGDCDLFCDEDVAYARRLSADGVQCQLNVVPGAYHGFDIVRSNAGVTRAFRAEYLAALAGGLDL